MRPSLDILCHYPLPLARVYLKLWNAAPAEKERVGYEVFEVITRYFAVVAVSTCLDEDRRDDALAERLKRLARPSAGDWCALVDHALSVLKRADALGPATGIEALWRQRQKALPALAALAAGLERSLPDRKPSGQASFALGAVAALAVAYRNQHLGHGAARPSPARAIEMGALFEAAAAELLPAAAFLASHRLFYVEEVRRRGEREMAHRLFALAGCNAFRAADLVTGAERALLPGRVYLRTGLDDGRFVPLHPFLRLHPDDLDVYFLNGVSDADAGTVDYLSYATGNALRRSDFQDDLRELLGLALGERVDSERLLGLRREAAAAADAEAGARAGADAATGTGAATGAGAAMAEGGRLVGHYRILGRVGAGGFGTVYEAWDTRLRRRVALKVARGEAVGPLEPELLERFRREAALAAELEHPNIVRVYEAGELEGHPYYAMEYVEGETLRAWIERHRETTPAELSRDEVRQVLRWGEQTARALHRAHTHRRAGGEAPSPIIHRDVKPENLVIGRDGAVKVLDFGLARDVGASVLLTQRSEVLGTPMYMSPEQATSSHAVDARTDVYSLGMTLYAAVTLREPFEGADSIAIRQALVTRDPPSPRRLAPRLPREVETIVVQATEKDPARRYATAEALAEDIRRHLDDEPILARAPGPLSRAWKAARRHRAAVGVAAALFLALAAGGGAALANRAAEARREREARIAEARDAAQSAWNDLAAARAAAPGEDGSEKKSDRLDQLVGLALRTLEAAGRLAALVPDGPEARPGAFRAAMALGEVAQQAQQWSLAAHAFGRARQLGVDDERAEEALEAVKRARAARVYRCACGFTIMPGAAYVCSECGLRCCALCAGRNHWKCPGCRSVFARLRPEGGK